MTEPFVEYAGRVPPGTSDHQVVGSNGIAYPRILAVDGGRALSQRLDDRMFLEELCQPGDNRLKGLQLQQ
jgi:hypothetical protein